ncbi:MAG: hypothetical protein ABI614_21660 [Planctomycetota bacterium]
MKCTRGMNVPLLLHAASSPAVADDASVESRILVDSCIKQEQPRRQD